MRPQFHFTARRGWINDPHGLTLADGRQHLFFQYVPDAVEWRPECRWGHAAGPDLLSLIEQPVALEPGDGDDGVWTGCIVEGQAGPVAFTTSVREPDLAMGRIRTATPTGPGLTAWQQGEVVAEAPPGLALTAFRDPFVFRDGERWRMLVGAGADGARALAVGFTSDDLRTWRADGVVAEAPEQQSQEPWLGAMWECPQLIEVDGRDVLLVSVWGDGLLHSAAYGVGRWHDGRFTADSWGRLSFGPGLYAPTTWRDAAGAPCVLAWIRGIEDLDEGWVGAHSIPYRLRLDGDRLAVEPHPDLDRYRRPTAPAAPLGQAFDLRWSPGSSDRLEIVRGEEPVLVAEVDDALLAAGPGHESWPMPHPHGPVRIVVDGPIAEVSTPHGWLAFAIEPGTEPLAVRGDSVEVHALIR